MSNEEAVSPGEDSSDVAWQSRRLARSYVPANPRKKEGKVQKVLLSLLFLVLLRSRRTEGTLEDVRSASLRSFTDPSGGLRG